MRKATVLQHISDRVRGCLYQDGEGAESVSEPDEDLRRLRKADVLPDK